MIRLGFGEALSKSPRACWRCASLHKGFQTVQTSHCGEATGNNRVLQGRRKVRWPLRCLAEERAFYTRNVLDIGIDSVVTRSSEGRKLATISLHHFTSVPFPVRLRVGYADSTTQDFSLPVNIWAHGNHFDAVVPVRANITGVRLWPDPSVPDWNSSNDTWGAPPRANPAGPVTRR